MVYVRSAPPELGGGVGEQTRGALQRIDELLALAGSDKSRLLTAQIKLADLALLPEHKDAWDEWLEAHPAPVRPAGQAPLEPQTVGEITGTPRQRPRGGE